TPARTKATGAAAGNVRMLERQIARLKSAHAAELRRHAKRIESLRRAADRRLATMVRDIAALRHHEARAAALERLLGGRGATGAALTVRLAELERRPPGPDGTRD